MTVDMIALQTEQLRSRSVEQRLAISAALRNAAWNLRRDVIARANPQWSHHEVQQAVRNVFQVAR